ncbi:MAG TPA: AI-2E family transporter [Gemmatimonadales bacterium]|nr:AI-2E family transporter [Gemmatimonadales bacterium]
MSPASDPLPAGVPPRASAGIVVLATLAVVAALYFGRELLVPVALAGLFTALLRPLVRPFERAGLSAPIGSTVVMLVLLGVLGVGASLLSGPVHQWLAQAPDTFAAAQAKLQSLRRPLQAVTSAVEKIERSTTGAGAPVDSAGRGEAGRQPGATATRPARREPAPGEERATAGAGAAGAGGGGPSGGGSVASIAARVFGTTTAVLAGIVEVVLLTFLLLASGDKFVAKLVHVLPLRRDKREAVAMVREAEGVVTRYLVATALINLGQGALVGVAMALLHVPNPVLWGLLTFLLEFIPYLGGACMIILLALIGLATFDSVGQAVLPPAIYLAITTLQNNLVSPVAYGQGLRLNPVAVFIGVLFWYGLWGVPGAFLAVPLVATMRILGEHIDGLAPVSEFLGE